MDRILADTDSRELRMLAKLYLRNHRADQLALSEYTRKLDTHIAMEEAYRAEIKEFHERIEATISNFTAISERGKGVMLFAAWIGGIVGFVWMLVQILERFAAWVRGSGV